MRSQATRRGCWCGAFGMWLALFGACAFAQDVEQLKHGVVRVLSQQAGIAKTGTGFIVKIDADVVHIVTATHVVQGAEKIEVEFFAKRDAPVPAKVGKMEDDSLRGIAFLVVRTSAPPGTRALALAPAIKLKDAIDEVLTIGFPQGAPAWSPKSLKFATRDGRELLFDGKVNQGNSGGPLIKDGLVVALVQSERDGYVRANPASAVLEFLEGSGLGLSAIAPPIDGPVPERTIVGATNLAQVSITDVVCDKESKYVGVITTGRAQGPVGSILTVDFDNKGSFFDGKLECGAWTRWRYGVACVREEAAPETMIWREKSQLSAIPQLARAQVGQPINADEVKPLAHDECRIASCDGKKIVCAAHAEAPASNAQPAPTSPGSPATSRPGIPMPPAGAPPPRKNEVAALSPRFSWGDTVRRSGLLVLTTSGQLWLTAAGGAEQNPSTHGAALAAVGDEYIVTSALHAHRLPVKITIRTDKILAGDFMVVCEGTNQCVAPNPGTSEREFREKMQSFFLEVAKTTLRRMMNLSRASPLSMT